MGTRNNTQVYNHAVAVLNKDLSPKTAATPAPAKSPAKTSRGGTGAGNAIPPRAAAAVAAPRPRPPSAPAPPTSARAAPRRRQAVPVAAVTPGGGADGSGGGSGGGGGVANTADAGAPDDADSEPSHVAVVENDSGNEGGGEGDGDEGVPGDPWSCGDGGLRVPAPVGGEASNESDKPKETKRKKNENEETLGPLRLRQDLWWDMVEHTRFVKVRRCSAAVWSSANGSQPPWRRSVHGGRMFCANPCVLDGMRCPRIVGFVYDAILVSSTDLVQLGLVGPSHELFLFWPPLGGVYRMETSKVTFSRRHGKERVVQRG